MVGHPNTPLEGALQGEVKLMAEEEVQVGWWVGKE